MGHCIMSTSSKNVPFSKAHPPCGVGSRPESGALTLTEIEERFDGNLCRCTGYRPILTAFHTFAGEEGQAKHAIEGAGMCSVLCVTR